MSELPVAPIEDEQFGDGTRQILPVPGPNPIVPNNHFEWPFVWRARGPLSKAEIQQVKRLLACGVLPADIAKAFRQRVQTIQAIEHKAKPPAAKSRPQRQRKAS